MMQSLLKFALGLSLVIGVYGFGQDQEQEPDPLLLTVSTSELTLKVGEKSQLTAEVKNLEGKTVEREVLFFSRSRRSVSVTPSGLVSALKPGEHTLIAMIPMDPERNDRRAEPLTYEEIMVTVPQPPIEKIEVANMPKRFFAGTMVDVQTRVVDTLGASRPDVTVAFKSNKPKVARFVGNMLMLGSSGKATLTMTAEGVSQKLKIDVIKNPVASISLTPELSQVRTGDVVAFKAEAKDKSGKVVADAPIVFTVMGRTHEDIIAPGAHVQIDAEGMFVAERSGVYTVMASVGSQNAAAVVSAASRDMGRELVEVGRGKVHDQHTSDLWVWEAPNGRDYAVTGTWGADGHAKVWDVTDPEGISLVGTMRVDARTVNDVKISADGRTAVISREGASSRKNGIVIYDVSDPDKGIQKLSSYTDQLHGGVHNLFIYKDHVFALSDATRYDIINIEDRSKPYRVGRFELENEGTSIHDVWVVDGIAYSSNWDDGVVAVDVGGGGKGGSFSNPVELGRYVYPSGWNHAAFPYKSQSTGKFLVFAGDEAFPYGLSVDPDQEPNRAAGWIHIIEWDEWENPREVARYFVPEAGTHNFWIEDDIMYVAMYNGGVRVVDVSGELRGDLYRQGREIASFIPNDPNSYMPNAPFTWGPQPFKGHLFISDWNSGLWALKLQDRERPLRTGEPQ